MAKKLWIIGLLALTFSLSGYAADGKKEAPAPAPASAPDPVFAIALEAPAKQLSEQLAVGLAESLKSGEFAAFEAVQPASAKHKFTADTFAKMRTALDNRYGKLTAAEYFGRLYHGKVMDFLWKFTFEKPGQEAGQVAHREILLMVRVGSVGGKPVIAGLRFNFF